MDPTLAQECRQRPGLLRLDVDQEFVRRIRRQPRLPRAQQVDANDGQQQQRHQPDAQRADLQARGQRAPAQVGKAIAPAVAALRNLLDRAQQQPRSSERHHEQRRDATQHDQPRLGVAGLPEDQAGDDRDAERVGEDARRIRRAQVAPQHAQRRHVRQRNQRRQREPEQQQHADCECGDDRRRAGPRQRRLEQRLQQPRQHLLSAERDDAAGDARRQAEPGELQHVQRQHPALRRAEAAHHARRIELSLQVAARSERDGDRGQQHGDQCREPEKFLRALQRRTHFGTQIADGFDSLPGGELRQQPCAILVGTGAGQQQPVAGAVAGLQQVGPGEILHRHQQLRRQPQETAGDFGLLLDDGADGERRIAQLDALARVERQTRAQPLVDPDRPRLRKLARSAAERMLGVFEQDLAAQRIARVGGLHFGEHRPRDSRTVCGWNGAHRGIGLHHAIEADALNHGQASTAPFVGERRRQRTISGEQQIGAKERAGLRAERRLHAVGEKPNGADARHRQQQRRRQHAQFAGATVANELAPSQGDEFNHEYAPWRQAKEMSLIMSARPGAKLRR